MITTTDNNEPRVQPRGLDIVQNPSGSAHVETPNEFQTLKEEMQSQYNTLKETFEASINELKQLNESLNKENTELKRALINSTFTTPQPKPVEKSEDELYAEKIDSLVTKAIEYSKR